MGSITPANREPLWDSGYDKSAPLYVLTSTLNKVRKNAIKLSDDYLESGAQTLQADTNHLCLRKGPSGSQVVFCINNKSSKGDSYELSVGGFDANDQVIEVTGCTTSQADTFGNVTMYMFNGEPRVYVPAAALKDTGLCTSTTAAGPGGSNAAPGLSMASSLVMAVFLGWTALFLA